MVMVPNLANVAKNTVFLMFANFFWQKLPFFEMLFVAIEETNYFGLFIK